MLSTQTRVRLYKTLIRPILEYPPIPICVTSQSNLLRLQRVQNIAIRVAAKEKPGEVRSTNEQLHYEHNLDTINTRIFDQAQKNPTTTRNNQPGII